MAKIKLSAGFTLCPKGHHVFKIESVKYDEDFFKMEINLVNQDGFKHKERYQFMKNQNEVNEVAMNLFSTLCKNAMNDFEMEELEDTNDLVGKYFECDVDHTKSEYNGKTYTNVRLNNIQPHIVAEPKQKSLIDILG